jgi:hypothetical protein
MDSFPDAGARNWLYKFVRENHWKAAPWIDFDDLVQEGYAAYYEVLYRYPDAKTPNHIMDLFKTTFYCRFVNIAKKSTKQPDDARSDIVEADANSPTCSDTWELYNLLRKAPKEIREALKLFTDGNIVEEPSKDLAKKLKMYLTTA